MRYAVLLSFLIFSPQAQAGHCGEFWKKHFIADDPFVADEIVAEFKGLYPNRLDLIEALFDLYGREIKKPHPDQRLLTLIEREVGE